MGPYITFFLMFVIYDKRATMQEIISVLLLSHLHPPPPSNFKCFIENTLEWLAYLFPCREVF